MVFSSVSDMKGLFCKMAGRAAGAADSASSSLPPVPGQPACRSLQKRSIWSLTAWSPTGFYEDGYWMLYAYLPPQMNMLRLKQ